jgi:hypothetical protein
MRQLTKMVALLPAALLLSACPKGQQDLTIRFESGRPVFDGDRRDCIILLRVVAAEASAGQVSTWSAASPLPIANDTACPLRLPIIYGGVPTGIASTPDSAPPLEPGLRYRVVAEGTDSDHEGEFTAP